MNIFIDCANYFAHGSVNLGDIAILRAMRSHLAGLFPGATVFAFTAAPEVIKRHAPGLIPVKIADTHTRGKNPIYIRGVENALENADMVLLSGGGFFSDHFAGHATFLLETLSLAQARNIPTAIMFAGFEPIHNETLVAMARSVLPKVGLIACRERLISPQILASYGVEDRNVAIGGDDAIEVAYSEKLDDRRAAVGFVVRQSDYARVGNLMANRIAAAVARAVGILGRQVIVLPTNLNLPSDDKASRNALVEAGLSPGNAAIDSLESLFAAIDQCRVVVTGSYHTGVFALSRGRPIIALAGAGHYRQKFNGLAAYFGSGCSVIELNDGFEPKLADTIAAAYADADDQRPTLSAVAKRHLSAQRALWNRLGELL